MTVTDPTNEWYTTSQQSGVTARPRRGVVLHHGATTSADQIIQMETSGSRQVSSNRVVKDKRCARVVSDDPNIRAWSLSDAYWDSVLSSVECANESTNGWTISDESHETIAQYVAYRASIEGWFPHRSGPMSGWTVLGHREIYILGGSYATACPGGMNLDWIAQRASEILKGIEVMATGNFPRNSKTGTIYWEREPGAPLYPVSAAEWKQIAGTFIDFAPTVMDDWIKRVGLVSTPALAVAPVNLGNVTFPPAPPADQAAIIAAIQALGALIVALPAEIDRYADGRKQAS